MFCNDELEAHSSILYKISNFQVIKHLNFQQYELGYGRFNSITSTIVQSKLVLKNSDATKNDQRGD